MEKKGSPQPIERSFASYVEREGGSLSCKPSCALGWKRGCGLGDVCARGEDGTTDLGVYTYHGWELDGGAFILAVSSGIVNVKSAVLFT